VTARARKLISFGRCRSHVRVSLAKKAAVLARFRAECAIASQHITDLDALRAANGAVAGDAEAGR
jgi:hypothetical protein